MQEQDESPVCLFGSAFQYHCIDLIKFTNNQSQLDSKNFHMLFKQLIRFSLEYYKYKRFTKNAELCIYYPENGPNDLIINEKAFSCIKRY